MSPTLSIWERNSFTSYDHIVLGGGIVGLTTAFYLKQKYPSHTVLVLERGLLPSGASTKNAGFACMGSPTELLDDLTHSSKEDVLELFMLRKKGLERLCNLLGDVNMGYEANGSHELLFEHDLEIIDQIDHLNQFLFSELKTNAFRIASDRIKEYKFSEFHVKGLIENMCEGEIDTGKTMKRLMELVILAGIEIKTGCEVTSFNDHPNGVSVNCKNPIDSSELVLNASTLCICNNAFAKTLLPEYDVVPGRGQVLITKPIDGLAFKGVFHFQQGYYYFREYHGCVLFGGGRNLDFQQEQTTSFELNETIQRELSEKLTTIILPEHSFEIDLRWTGIMAFGETKRPILKQHSDHVYVGVRMGGMGVAIGSEVGYELASLI